MKQTQLQALSLFAAASHNRFDTFYLAGPSNVRTRVAIMALLTGNKMPQSKCGITIIRKLFLELAGVTGDCIAAQDEAFAEWAVKQLEAN